MLGKLEWKLLPFYGNVESFRNCWRLLGHKNSHIWLNCCKHTLKMRSLALSWNYYIIIWNINLHCFVTLSLYDKVFSSSLLTVSHWQNILSDSNKQKNWILVSLFKKKLTHTQKKEKDISLALSVWISAFQYFQVHKAVPHPLPL